MRPQQHTAAVPSITPSADTAAAYLEALAGIPAYIRKLERKQAASEKSIRVKTQRIAELEGKLRRSVPCARTGWIGALCVDPTIRCVASRPRTRISRRSSTSTQDVEEPTLLAPRLCSLVSSTPLCLDLPPARPVSPYPCPRRLSDTSYVHTHRGTFCLLIAIAHCNWGSSGRKEEPCTAATNSTAPWA